MMYFIRRKYDVNTTLRTLVRLYSFARKSHYEVLNVKKNCSSKEIKDAFIRKSKEYHPDKNKDRQAQEKFVQIVEAYNVLSKPDSRALYDSLSVARTVHYTRSPSSHSYQDHSYYDTNNFYTYGKRERKMNYGDETNQRSPVKKVPNYVIIAMCFGFAFVGFLIQMVVIRETFKVNQRKAIEKSRLIGEELERVRASARQNGNEMQTRILLDKIAAGSNPTVATASLGHALANEKKDAEETFLSEFGLLNLPKDWSPDLDNDVKEFSTKISYNHW